MVLPDEQAALLWEESGGSCAICERALAPSSDMIEKTGRLLGTAACIDPSFAHEDGSPYTYENAILVCPVDSGYIEGLRNWFDVRTLRRLKESCESEWRYRQTLAPWQVAVTARAHTGSFDTNATPMIFVKIKNISLARQVTVDNLWFEGRPSVGVDNPHRPLPRVLEPGEILETWIPLAELAHIPSPLTAGRVTVDQLRVVPTTRNDNLSPAGFIGGLGSPLDAIALNTPREGSAEETYDVFISHASEDKEAVARPLREHLSSLGVKTFLDEVDISIGQSIRQRIDRGLALSRFAVVVLSPRFFEKGWTTYELNAIVALSADGKQSVLPIWHNITKDQVQAASPLLAGLLGMSTGQYSIADIGTAIARRVDPDLYT